MNLLTTPFGLIGHESMFTLEGEAYDLSDAFISDFSCFDRLSKPIATTDGEADLPFAALRGFGVTRQLGGCNRPQL